MKLKRTLAHYFTLGSLAIYLCTMLCSCKTEKTDYVFRAEWVYINSSSEEVELMGILDLSSTNNELNVKIKQEESYTNIMSELGGPDEVAPEDYPLLFTEECRVVINDIEYKIAEPISFLQI